MFFGGFSGPTAFFSRKVVGDRPYIPPIVLTDFQDYSELPSSLSKRFTADKVNRSYTDAITLSRKQSGFSIGFSALRAISMLQPIAIAIS